ncbi:MAG: adenosine-specific kinase [Spirochaetaceae bacterium]|nr:adenosine-specific kinase [Spirochaetaceae bacterium]
MTLESVRLDFPEGCNIIVGQSHFIKTVEDIAEIMVASVPGVKFGLAFNEASGPCLVRTEGNDPELVSAAERMAQNVGAGHTFYLIIGPGAFPINVLDRIKACPEVCRIFCATANPVEVIRSVTEQGAGILGVIDGFSPKGVEGPEDKATRKAMLRRFGYKF